MWEDMGGGGGCIRRQTEIGVFEGVGEFVCLCTKYKYTKKTLCCARFFIVVKFSPSDIKTN